MGFNVPSGGHTGLYDGGFISVAVAITIGVEEDGYLFINVAVAVVVELVTDLEPTRVGGGFRVVAVSTSGVVVAVGIIECGGTVAVVIVGVRTLGLLCTRMKLLV